jgi:hypothetical protein
MRALTRMFRIEARGGALWLWTLTMPPCGECARYPPYSGALRANSRYQASCSLVASSLPSRRQ